MAAIFPLGLQFLSCCLSCPKAKIVVSHPYKASLQSPKLIVLLLSLWWCDTPWSHLLQTVLLTRVFILFLHQPFQIKYLSKKNIHEKHFASRVCLLENSSSCQRHARNFRNSTGGFAGTQICQHSLVHPKITL